MKKERYEIVKDKYLTQIVKCWCTIPDKIITDG